MWVLYRGFFGVLLRILGIVVLRGGVILDSRDLYRKDKEFFVET